MLKYFIVFLIFLSAFPTCCNEESIETERVLLSEKEKNLIPYKINQTIKFQHSNGFNFDFQVINDEYSLFEDNYCDECCGGEFTSYQERIVNLKSTVLNLNITLKINSLENINNSKILDVSINNSSGFINYDNNFQFDCSQSNCLDEFTLHNIKFNDVIIIKLEKNWFINENNTLFPEKIVYNSNFGIIQIVMSNNETYSILN